MNELISVVVPVFNTGPFLKECIESILNQKYQNLELLLIDDGSVDSSGAICDAYQAQDSRVQVLHVKNGGPSRARNIGISQMHGQYLLFVDSDDELLPGAIQTVINTATRSTCDVVIFGFRVQKQNRTLDIVPPKGLFNRSQFGNQYIDLCLKYIINSPINKLFKRELVQRCEFQEDMKLGEDLLFCNSYLRQCDSFSLISEPLYLYKQRESGSLSTSYHPELFSWYVRHYEDTVRTMKTVSPNWDEKNCSQLYSFYGKYIKEAINACGGKQNKDNMVYKLIQIRHICDEGLTRESIPYMTGNRLYIMMLSHRFAAGLLLYILISGLRT